ncbi:MAG: hypothetical protein JNK19_13600 [Tabrizicola sp.]|nr:hypothetical protein [Tabrizicola sp.]
MAKATPYYGCYRLVSADEQKKVGGTCLIVRNRESLFLATARHCVDKKYRDPSASSSLPKSVLVHGFVKNRSYGYSPSEGMTFHLGDWVFDASDNDVAVARINGFTQRPVYLWAKDLFEPHPPTDLSIGTEVQFSGYPEGIQATDEAMPSMVLRKGVIASHPQVNISVPKALGSEYALIDAFSQNGFSGAPVFALIYREVDLLRELIDFGTLLTNKRLSLFPRDKTFVQCAPEYQFLGINCGHFQTISDRSNGVHAGLSYYVRAKCVIETLRNCAQTHLDRFITVGVANSPIQNSVLIEQA